MLNRPHLTHRTAAALATVATMALALSSGATATATATAAAADFGSLGGAPSQSAVGTSLAPAMRPAAEIVVGQVGGTFEEIRVEMYVPAGVAATSAQVTVTGPAGVRTVTAPVTCQDRLVTVVVPGPIEPGSTVTVSLAGLPPASGAVSGVIGTDPTTSIQLGSRLSGGAAQLG